MQVGGGMDGSCGHWWWEMYTGEGMGVGPLYDRNSSMSNFVTISYSDWMNNKN